MTFTGPGLRQLQTMDLNLTQAYYIQFVIMLGYTNTGTTYNCPAPSQSAYGIEVGFSTNGGLNYQQIQQIPFSSYRTPSIVTINLPAAAQTAQTRIVFWQPQHGAANYDVWVC